MTTFKGNVACTMPWGSDAHTLTAELQHTRAMCVCADNTVVLAAGYAPQYTLHTAMLHSCGAATVRHLAGHGSGFENGVGAAAMFNLPIDLAANVDGTVLVADYFNHAIRLVNTYTARVTTFCTALDYPQNVCLCPDGTVLVLGQKGIRSFSSAGDGGDFVCDGDLVQDVSVMASMPHARILLCCAHGSALRTIDAAGHVHAWPTADVGYVEAAAVDTRGTVFAITKPGVENAYFGAIEMIPAGASTSVAIELNTSRPIEPRCIALTNDHRVLIAGFNGLFTFDHPDRLSGFFPRWTAVWCKCGPTARSTMSEVALQSIFVVLLLHARSVRTNTACAPILPIELWYTILGFVNVAHLGVAYHNAPQEYAQLGIERRENARLRFALRALGVNSQ